MRELHRSSVYFSWLIGFLAFLTLKSAFAQEPGIGMEPRERMFKLGVAASVISTRNEPTSLSPPLFLGLAGQLATHKYLANPFLRSELGIMTDGGMTLPYFDIFGGSYLGRRELQPFIGAGFTYPYNYYFWGTGLAYKRRIMLGTMVYSSNPGKMYSLELSWFPRRKAK